MFRGISVVALLVALSIFPHQTVTRHINAMGLLGCAYELQQAKTGMVNITGTFTEEGMMGCVWGCLWRETEALNADNSFNATKWIENTADFKPELTDAFNECTVEKGAELCETGSKFHACLINHGLTM